MQVISVIKAMSPRNLFIVSLIAIISVYLYIFGQEKTIELIKEEYLFILHYFPVTLTLLYFKMKVKGRNLIDFNKNNGFFFKKHNCLFSYFSSS